jgi:hypothetical protein
MQRVWMAAALSLLPALPVRTGGAKRHTMKSLGLFLLLATSMFAIQPASNYPCWTGTDALAAKICSPLDDSSMPQWIEFVAASSGATTSQLYIDGVRYVGYFRNGEFQMPIKLSVGTHRLLWRVTDRDGEHTQALAEITVK